MTFPIPTDEPETEPVTYWALYEDGSAGLIKTTTGEEPVLTKPGQLVTEEEYTAKFEELRAAHEAHVAQLQAEDEQRTREDYDALIGAGVPEATARRMSGYQGEAVVEAVAPAKAARAKK
ncbi:MULTISPECIES: hypothetical protein [unclassified Streptomyces]|uniref:hypothetical protein n=1 Tax=unclassified Streptomyces TaxID=2593676 RepID=UPI00038248E2|nr:MULTISPECIES: hypothetical protein [unclassified Streptomyces]MYX39055.1 hypothetical protein [Streptomyces sp. SID8377]